MFSIYESYDKYLELITTNQSSEINNILEEIDQQARSGHLIYFPDKPEFSICSWELVVYHLPFDIRSLWYDTNWFWALPEDDRDGINIDEYIEKAMDLLENDNPYILESINVIYENAAQGILTRFPEQIELSIISWWFNIHLLGVEFFDYCTDESGWSGGISEQHIVGFLENIRINKAAQKFLALIGANHSPEMKAIIDEIERQARLGQLMYFPNKPELSIYSWQFVIHAAPELLIMSYLDTNWFWPLPRKEEL